MSDNLLTATLSHNAMKALCTATFAVPREHVSHDETVAQLVTAFSYAKVVIWTENNVGYKTTMIEVIANET